MARGISQQVCLSTAYDLGCTDFDRLRRINSACLSGGLEVLLLDSLIDHRADPMVTPARDFFLCRALYNFYIEDLIAITGESAARAVSSLAHLDAETLGLHYEEELIHAGAVSFQNARTIEQRCGLVKPVIHELLILCDRQDLESDLFAIVENASFSACTLDDMCDWREDVASRRYTYPIQLAANRAGLRLDELSEDNPALYRQLVASDLYHELMKEVSERLRLAESMARQFSPKLAYWLRRMANGCLDSWRSHIEFLYSIGEDLSDSFHEGVVSDC